MRWAKGKQLLEVEEDVRRADESQKKNCNYTMGLKLFLSIICLSISVGSRQIKGSYAFTGEWSPSLLLIRLGIHASESICVCWTRIVVLGKILVSD